MKVRKYPRGVSEFLDRHGKLRVRGRRAGWPAYYFKHQPGSGDFEAELREWLAGAITRAPIGNDRARPGTISFLIVKYYRSAEFWKLAQATQATYRGILERFRMEHGDKSIAGLHKRKVRELIEGRRDTPSAANNLLQMLRIIMKFAVEEEMRADDPTVGVRPIGNKTDGFHSWSEDEIGIFEAKHPVGSRARLAFALLLYTGQRRSDVIRMGRQHIRDNCISVRQQKTGQELRIPIHRELARIIAATASGNLTFLVTNEKQVRQSKPFTGAGFTNWFREMCREARLPHCSSHGLRKAMARRLAEAGCSEHEIAAITGHRSLQEVRRYTAAANQVVLAQRAIEAIPGSKSEQNLANPGKRLAKKRAK